MYIKKKCTSENENTAPINQSNLPKVSNNTSIIAKDAQTSTMEIISAGKPCQKMNGLKKNETNVDLPNTTNEQENGTNSGHSSSNESNNIDKRKKGQ